MLAVDLLDWDAGIRAGEVAVALGTLALAAFTWRLASVTTKVERQRRDREAKGWAYLISAELALTEEALGAAEEAGRWGPTYLTPHAGWSHGGPIVTTAFQSSQSASSLSNHVAQVMRWEGLAATQGEFALTDLQKTQIRVLREGLGEDRLRLYEIAWSNRS